LNDYRYKSFSEFWPFYVSEHSKPATRVLHLIGTTLGIGLLVYLIATGRWWLFFLGFVPGYGFAWLAHFIVEKNKPATFKYPLWSFMGVQDDRIDAQRTNESGIRKAFQIGPIA